MTEICVAMVAYNEEHTIDLALRSTFSVADRIVVVDNGSTDETIRVASDILTRYDGPSEIYEEPELDLASVRYRAIQQAAMHSDWVWIVDSDHVIRDDYLVRDLAETHDGTDTYFCFKYINLYGDFEHTWSQQQVAPPHPALISTSAEIQHAENGSRLNLPHVPNHTRVNNDIYAVNCNGLKSAKRMYARNGFVEWQDKLNKGETSAINPMEYWLDKKDLTSSELEGFVTEWCIDKFDRQCVPLTDHFSLSLQKLLPDVILGELASPRFRLVKDADGRVIGREPDLPAHPQSL